MAYSELYSKTIKEDLPPFPKSYPTGVILGKVDLVDIISESEYMDFIP